MTEPRIYVDFNEMLDTDLVLLSKSDLKLDSQGNEVRFKEGDVIKVYMDDIDENGQEDYLIAEGIVERNTKKEGWGAIAKWNCRINKNGIRHESDLH